MKRWWRLPVTGAIVIFWGTMWVLLIRSELRPAETGLRVLPVQVVLRQYFQHEQASALFLRERGENIGHLRLAPRLLPEGSALAFLGGLQFHPAGGLPQRSVLEGTLTLDRELHPQSVRGTFMNRALAPATLAPVRVEYQADFSTRRGHYRYAEEQRTVMEQDFTLDEAGLEEILQAWGIGPEWRKQAPPISLSKPEVTARQTRLQLHDEPTDVTEIAVRLGGQTWLQVAIGPLGQVLEVKTLWGWTLSAE